MVTRTRVIKETKTFIIILIIIVIVTKNGTRTISRRIKQRK